MDFKYKKSISVLAVLIVILALFASVCGLLPGEGIGFDFNSLHGQSVDIYGKGLYRYDSVSVAAQAVGQDFVTLVLGIPLLLISLYLARKGSVKGKLLLTGALGYFLYTYASYSFLSMYNSLFLVDVALMSLSFFAFVLSMMSYDVENLRTHFSEKLPVKTIGGLLIFVAAILGLMWLKVIVTPLSGGQFPVQLEHYTTLVIQALDLGFVIPTAILSGVLLIKRKPFGYLLASVIAVKEATLLAAITAMIVVQGIFGIEVSIPVIAAFSVFDLVMAACLVTIMRNVKVL